MDQLDNFIPLNFLIILLTERQSAWMSKISYDGLTRSDTGNSGRQRVNELCNLCVKYCTL